MKSYFLAALIGLMAVLILSVSVSWAWQKDKGASCERVFASIQNEEGNRNWDGTVTANGNVVVTQSGSATSNQWATVEWIPTSGFSGTVEATVRLLNVNGETVADSETIEGNLDCPEPSPNPTQEVTPTPTTTPSNPGGPGDGRTDSLGCQHPSDNCGGSSPASTVPIKAVLGLSTTSGEENYLLQFAQLFGALTSAGLGFIFFKKNA